MVWPTLSRFIQRCREATQSLASTVLPSWKVRPSRNLMVQRLPSSSSVWPAAICGEGSSFAFRPYSVSNTRKA